MVNFSVQLSPVQFTEGQQLGNGVAFRFCCCEALETPLELGLYRARVRSKGVDGDSSPLALRVGSDQ